MQCVFGSFHWNILFYFIFFWTDPNKKHCIIHHYFFIHPFASVSVCVPVNSYYYIYYIEGVYILY